MIVLCVYKNVNTEMFVGHATILLEKVEMQSPIDI